jgi:predicted lipoprotein with Yx(FWY)xxD motif
MHRLITIAAVAAIAASLALAACGDDDEEEAATAAPQAQASAEADAGDGDGAAEQGQGGGAQGQGGGPDQGGGEGQGGGEQPGITIATGDSQFGEILFDGSDQVIYLFDKESTSNSECYGDCAAAWPPVLTDGEPQADGGVEAKLLGTTERDDGSTQVTYGGHPLYYYVDDPVGEVLCHNVEEFGGLWLVVEPGGDAVQ